MRSCQKIIQKDQFVFDLGQKGENFFDLDNSDYGFEYQNHLC